MSSGVGGGGGIRHRRAAELTTRVYFDFEDDKVADRFCHDVMDWLTDEVPVMKGKRVTNGLRHWLYEDASPSSERLPVAQEGEQA